MSTSSNLPPYRVVCKVDSRDRKFWEPNGFGYPHSKTEGAIVFFPPFDIKANTPCMIAPTDEDGATTKETTHSRSELADDIPL